MLKRIKRTILSLAITAGLVFALFGGREGYQKLMETKENVNDVLKQAEELVKQYDYEDAVRMLEDAEKQLHLKEIKEAIESYKEEQESLRPVDVTDIPHIFFHSLIIDTERAFDDDEDSAGYNQYMTTEAEFREILTQLYNNGYVLVSPHDAYVETEEGFVPGEILLPRGKRPLIISQDDVNYYDYMTGDGFASRLVLDQDGHVQAEYTDAEGNVLVGAYDLVPILDEFISENPDFSYKGARAVLAVTGYEGVFGYHNVIDPKSAAYAEECRTVSEIADALRAEGYELASHTYGHIQCGTVSAEALYADTEAWETQIGALIGGSDILIYPYGEDISSNVAFDCYEASERFNILYEAGFRYYMNVDSTHTAWVQLCNRYVRNARRNIDGFRMRYFSKSMKDLFYDFDAVYDWSRPPVDRL